MDLKQLEYIVRIAEENNITHAAAKLFITQSALNQQLLKLEKELETPLFHRSRSNWRLTEAGEIYVRAAKEMLQIKSDTYNRIYDINDRQKGSLSIGFTPGRGINMFSSVYPEFHRTHYGIQVTPQELSVQAQHSLLDGGDLDIGFMTLLPEQKKYSLKYQTIVTEEIYLAIPARHPLSQYAAPKGKPFCELDIAMVKEEPFVLMYQTSTIRLLVDAVFAAAGFEPHVLFETANTNTIVTMIRSELCCGLLPAYYVDQNQTGICYFTLPSRPRWEVTAAHKKNHYISKAAKDFISLAASQWQCSASYQ